MDRNFWRPTLFATAAILVANGIRNTIGLLVNPLVENTVLSLTQVSMALAIGQFTFGLFQPLGGILTTKYSTFKILLSGAICLILGFLGVCFDNSVLALILCFGLLTPAGAAASSFPILMGHISSSVPDEKRAFSGGFINAGGSAGQFVLAPLIQVCLNTWGLYGACVFLAGAVALSLVPSWYLCHAREPLSSTPAPKIGNIEAIDTGLKKEIAGAFRNRSYLFLHLGFLACGFHVAFLGTHLPGEIALFGFSGSFSALCFSIIGICNITGCILVGIAGGFFKLKNILAGLYGIRLLLIGLYILAPKTAPVFIAFAVISGLTWGSTVPPTGAITARLVHPRNVSTLFALVFVTHQAGAFFGAWLGGFVMEHSGSFMPMWILNAALSTLAAIISFSIDEHKTPCPSV